LNTSGGKSWCQCYKTFFLAFSRAKLQNKNELGVFGAGKILKPKLVFTAKAIMMPFESGVNQLKLFGVTLLSLFVS